MQLSNLSNVSILLLLTVVHNHLHSKAFEESLLIKIWDASKHQTIQDVNHNKNVLQLYIFIFEHVNNEEFNLITNDLFEITVSIPVFNNNNVVNSCCMFTESKPLL